MILSKKQYYTVTNFILLEHSNSIVCISPGKLALIKE
jgi:hypothetical protein